ncbi:Uncharacterised protein [uncultured archaeon]|nr:Uncharacterised protein [uncultured archaeon]
MDNNAKSWLESRLMADEGCEGMVDPTIRLARLWKSIQEEIPGLLAKTVDCVAFDRQGKTIVSNQEKLDELWNEINSRKARIQAIEDAARKLVELDGRGFCPIKRELNELQIKASLAPNPEDIVHHMYMKSSARADREELRKRPDIIRAEEHREEILAPLRPLMLDALRKIDAYAEILAEFVKLS